MGKGVRMDAAAEEAFLGFVSARSMNLLRLGFALSGDQAMAEDLVQGALEKLARHWARVDDPEAYAKRIVYRDYVSLVRRLTRRREYLTPTPPDRATAADHAAEIAVRDEVQRALTRLGPRQRAVIVLRYLEDYSERDVAQLIGCSTSTVSSQLSRARARLRQLCPHLNADTAEARQ